MKARIGRLPTSFRSAVGISRVSPNIRKILNNGAWTVGGKIVSQGAQLASFILAARFLTSAEFGFFAFTSAIALFFIAIAEGGWGEFVMKSPEDRNVLNQVATVAFISGTFFLLLGVAGSYVVEKIYHENVEALLLVFFSFWILPSSVSTVYDGLLVARGQLKTQSIIRIGAELVGLAVVSAGIWYGWGVVALVVGRLVSQLVSLSVSIAVVQWVPRPGLTKPLLFELLEFSRHIILNRLILFLRSYSATLVVGGFLGLAEAGYYRAAERIVAAFSELIGEPARILGWTILRKAATPSPEDGGNQHFARVATKFITLLLTVAMPAYTGLALVSDNLVHFALGASWAPTGFLVLLLALKQILIIPGYVTEPLLSLSGTIRKMPTNVLINSFVGVTLLVCLAPFGMIHAAMAQCIAAVFSLATSMRLQGRYGQVRWNTVLKDSIYLVIALALMAVAVLGMGDIAADLDANRLSTLIVQICTGAIVYFVALLALQRFSGRQLAIFGLAR